MSNTYVIVVRLGQSCNTFWNAFRISRKKEEKEDEEKEKEQEQEQGGGEEKRSYN